MPDFRGPHFQPECDSRLWGQDLQDLQDWGGDWLVIVKDSHVGATTKSRRLDQRLDYVNFPF